MPKIHYHSECSFFAGCENMLPNFFNSDELRSKYSMSFSFVGPPIYLDGLKKRLSRPIKIYRIVFINLPPVFHCPAWLPQFFGRLIIAPFRLIFYFPSLLAKSIILLRVFKKVNPDILHINNGGYPGASSSLAAVMAGKALGVKGIVMVVNNMAVGYGSPSRWIEFPVDYLVRRYVNYFVTGSRAAAIRLGDVLNVSNNKLKVIPNGLALNPLKNDDQKNSHLDGFHGRVFGVVALLVPRKGHLVLFNAVLSLIKKKNYEGGEFIVLVEGSGYLKESLLKFVCENNLSKWIRFVGDQPDIIQFISNLDALILPSIRDEDFPNVVLEAMSLGKAVIASRLAGTPDQVENGVTGILFEPGNVKQLSDAIHDLIFDNDLTASMGAAALVRFNQHFTLAKSLAGYDDLYTKLLKNG